MAEAMEDVEWRDPQVPMASNASGGLVTSADAVREALIAQIASPVRWVDCIRTLDSDGATSYIEIGSGRVLSGLVKQILGMETDVVAADTAPKLENAAAAKTAPA
jgi:[acyl-carrier-protein] S-malonyltransferase